MYKRQTFTVNDIKALVTLVHNSTNTKFVSLRCNKDVQDPVSYTHLTLPTSDLV